MSKLNKMRQQMTDEFIAALSQDIIPWHQEWSTLSARPYNAVNDTIYHGGNSFWLTYVAQEKGYNDPRWCTFKQAKDQGWSVKRGEKGTPIEFWSLYDSKEKKTITREEAHKLEITLTDEEFIKRVKPVSNTFYVFNAAQLKGVPELDIQLHELKEDELIQLRDKLIKNLNVGFIEGGNQAGYSTVADRIVMPKINRFESEYAYMSTFLHEAAHSTGSADRLDRNMSGEFGSPEYAKEELRAEIASAFTAQLTGIQYKENECMENHKAYIQNWIAMLKNNPNELFAAIRDAEKISDYLLEQGEIDIQRTISNEVNEEITQNELIMTVPEQDNILQKLDSENYKSRLEVSGKMLNVNFKEFVHNGEELKKEAVLDKEPELEDYNGKFAEEEMEIELEIIE